MFAFLEIPRGKDEGGWGLMTPSIPLTPSS
jgi:hypothetical protein